MHLTLTSKSAGRPLVLALLTLVFLPYDTLICLDAILRSGVRMLFTRRGLLLWHLPSYARRNARRTLVDFFVEMWIAPVLAAVLGVSFAWVLGGNRPAELLFSAPVLLLWLLSPVVAWWISMPLVSPVPDLTVEQQAFLRVSARRTWRFFADFVGPQDNWLPPDNFQQYPAPAIASRTSPTNIGMALLANLAAYDFGYIGAGEFLQAHREHPGHAWKSWNVTAAIFTIGMTPAPCNRFARNTSLRWTAVTWPAACSPCRRDCSS